VGSSTNKCQITWEERHNSSAGRTGTAVKRRKVLQAGKIPLSGSQLGEKKRSAVPGNIRVCAGERGGVSGILERVGAARLDQKKGIRQGKPAPSALGGDKDNNQ